MTKSIKILTDFCGKPPTGFTAPAWHPHPEQISIMEELGLSYGMLSKTTILEPEVEC